MVILFMKKQLDRKKRIQNLLKRYVMITLGAFIYSLSICIFLDPNNIAPGGISGIAILANRFTHIETGTLVFYFNIPIVLLGLWKFGWRFIISTFYSIFSTSVFINALTGLGAVTDDLLIASVLGGALMSIALAFTFKAGATTGGTDIIVKVLRTRYPHIKTGILFLGTDAAVVIASWIVFRNITVAFYAGVAVVINMIVFDFIIYGGDEAKLIYIISDEIENIRVRILEELDITATIIPAWGAYSQKEKKVLMVVMRKQMAPLAEEIIKEEDQNAFMIVSSASEIFGEGYKNITEERI